MKPAETEFVDSLRRLQPDKPVVLHFSSVLSTGPFGEEPEAVSHQTAWALNRCNKDCVCFQMGEKLSTGLLLPKQRAASSPMLHLNSSHILGLHCLKMKWEPPKVFCLIGNWLPLVLWGWCFTGECRIGEKDEMVWILALEQTEVEVIAPGLSFHRVN